MCGILCICCPNDSVITNTVAATIRRRGPDVNGETQTQLCSTDASTWRATFYGYTLWLQGDTPAVQPLTDESGNILLWNGDVFYNSVAGKTISVGKSDSEFLLETLQNADSVQDICSILDSVHGPWAVVYFQRKSNVIITGRDRFGRHSLLWNCKEDQKVLGTHLLLSSVADESGDFSEVPASSLYEVNFCTVPPTIQAVHQRNVYSINKQLPSANWSYPEKSPASHILQEYSTLWQKEIDHFEATLLESVKVRISCQPMLCKSCVKKTLEGGGRPHCQHSKLAVMFSGGLDSTVLAALADRIWPAEEAIDLLNVAFPSPTRAQAPAEDAFNVPDRLTGLQALEELKTLSPTRKWNFVKVNVPLVELVSHRSSRIAALIQPASTVLDDSIGCAQWFAARGEGMLLDQSSIDTYVSPARVILMGAGADEQMAGYARHRQRFAQGGWPALAAEIEMEMQRISERNLGRDNRIIADHGRAPRLPYLDERVVECLADIPVWVKADLRLPAGLGDKIILRALANRLGLHKTAIEPKRAIQFGSRIAKTETRKEKGSQRCDRLLTKPVSLTAAE